MKGVRTFLKFPRAAMGRSAAEKDVLLSHLEYADDKTGETIVSAQRIADDLGISARQVQKMRKALIDAGLLVPTGSRRTTTGNVLRKFRIIYETNSQFVSNANSEFGSPLPKRTPDTGKANSEFVSNATSEFGRSREAHYQENLDQERETAALFSADDFSDDMKIVQDDWNKLADDLGLARVSLLTSGRKSKLKARLHEAGGIAGWRHALERIRNATWMHSANARGWRVTFDWILQPDKFAQLLEGALDDRTASPTRTASSTSGKGRNSHAHRRKSLTDAFDDLEERIANDSD